MFLVFFSNLSVGVLINFVLIKKKKCIRVTLLMGLSFTSLHPEAKELINLLGCFYLVEFIFMSYLSMLIWGKPYNFSPMLRRCTYYQSVAWITYFPDTFFQAYWKWQGESKYFPNVQLGPWIMVPDWLSWVGQHESWCPTNFFELEPFKIGTQ